MNGQNKPTYYRSFAPAYRGNQGDITQGPPRAYQPRTYPPQGQGFQKAFNQNQGMQGKSPYIGERRDSNTNRYQPPQQNYTRPKQNNQLQPTTAATTLTPDSRTDELLQQILAGQQRLNNMPNHLNVKLDEITNHVGNGEPNNQNAPLLVGEKLDDPGEYLVPLMIYREIIPKCVCDTGSDINIMPLEIGTQLWQFKFEQTDTNLLLPNGAVIEPVGALSRVPIQIRNFVMPTDFVVVDAHRMPGTPFVLGRLFLATVEALVDASRGFINFRRLGCKFKLTELVDSELTLMRFEDSDSDNDA